MIFFDEEERYKRQIDLKGVGVGGMKKLKKSKVLVIGAGGLGSPALLYLCGSGVGTIGICDGDKVDITNLHRQVLYDENDIDEDKVNCSKKKLKKLNSDTYIYTYGKLTKNNVDSIIKNYDFVIEATDDVRVKFLINDICKKYNKPFSIGGVLRYKGQVMTVVGKSPCYRSLFKEEPQNNLVETCSEAGVLGVVPGVIGIIQATEALKYLLNIGELLVGKVLIYDALNLRFKTLKLES